MLRARLRGALSPRRSSLWLRPMGACSCASDTAPAAWDAAIVSLGAARFGQPAGVTDAQSLAAARLVVFGEIHSMPPCIELLQRTASSMMAHAAAAGGTLHVVLEHLNFEQQPLLDGYAARSLDMAELIARYEEGPEGHDLAPYEPLFELAREPPAAAAAAAAAEGVEAALPPPPAACGCTLASFPDRTRALSCVREWRRRSRRRATRGTCRRARIARRPRRTTPFESLLTGRSPATTSARRPPTSSAGCFPRR